MTDDDGDDTDDGPEYDVDPRHLLLRTRAAGALTGKSWTKSTPEPPRSLRSFEGSVGPLARCTRSRNEGVRE
ncbi:hypothetical protein [Halomarina rubra]|uniref:Uncharacterized protein n=1 Tax=Halomarina rubra TaxID=2071873 RepID=A0ABD6ATF6_9EURY|nr:hypothetical protein [Halomarina rubra]